MDIDNLVRMANRIGDYFSAYPDRNEAEASIARHIQMFWTPPMRRELLACVARDDGMHGMHTLVADAVRKHLAQPATASTGE
ncbi:MAG: formate dehydrogenase subunit delta [Proteobacteria bacterium]|nr:formate dehydrogenase subunit delta [Pseudomonadota bacterium]MBS0509568.1 formate dehydrogenase subunit delta [Pseudomonadota bacterium]MBS0552188.1 formate dehydrogenase subunit delta [Pseudomonadota bacterium]